jgi:NCS1 family nucleobase:cation symporter-1
LSIGLSLAGAFGLMVNVGDWGWLIGSSSGAWVHVAASRAARVRAPGFA